MSAIGSQSGKPGYLTQSRESLHCTQFPVKVVSQSGFDGFVAAQVASLWQVTQKPGATQVPPVPH